MGVCPVHDLPELFPVGNILEIDKSQGSPRNDESVVAVLFYFIKGLVKVLQMFERRVLRCMGNRVHQVNLYLEWCIGKEP